MVLGGLGGGVARDLAGAMKPAKVVQIAWVAGVLYAVDADGEVWAYYPHRVAGSRWERLPE